MGKLLRIGAYLLLALVALIVIAAVVIPMVVDPNDYKDDIAAAVESQTGRRLMMDGDIGLSVFPWLALEIGPTRLSNAAGFSDRPFAAVKQVSVRIKLLPLLRRQVEMDTVVLDGLQLSLEKHADGVTNWDDLVAQQTAAQEQPAPEQPAEPAEGGMALAGLAIGGVQITDANVLWDDAQAGSRYEIEGLSLRTGAIEPGATVPVELGLDLNASEPQVQGPVAFSGEVTVSEDNQTVRMAKAKFSADLKGTGVPGGALEAGAGFESVLDLAAGDLDVPRLVVEVLGLTLEGKVKGSGLFSEPSITADMKLGDFVPREVIEALGQPVPEVSDPTVLGKADASLKLAATADSVRVSDLQMRMDDSTLAGGLSVANFAKPAIRFDLHLDAIDVDRYLPPQAEQPPQAPATPATGAAAAAGDLFPVETLRALNIDGSVKIDRLKAFQLSSTDILVKLTARDGRVRVHPAQARMYQGSYKGDLGLDVTGKQPKISMNEKLDGVQVGPLLKDLTGDDKLSGATRAGAVLTTGGQTQDALKQNLNGTVEFAFTNGAVKGMNLAALIRNAQARLKGETPPADEGPNQTDFSEMTGTAQVANGVISNNDLKAKSPLLRVEGKGGVDLPKESLDYLLTTKIVGSLEGQGGKTLEELKGVAIPVQISGSLAKPDYQVRLDRALQDAAEEKVKKKIGKQLDKQIEKGLDKDLGDKLKGLLR